MKKLFAILILGALLTACSGVSNKDKDYMQIVLKNELFDRYQKADYPIMFMQVEITKIKKEAYSGTSGKYSGYFKCNFTENDKKITFYGDAGFDENMEISAMPEAYGDKKIAIYINAPYTVDTEYYSAMPDTCKYILDCFMNRNKITGNETSSNN